MAEVGRVVGRLFYLLVEGLPQPFQGQDAQRVPGDRAEALRALLAGEAAAVVQGLVAEWCQVVAPHVGVPQPRAGRERQHRPAYHRAC